MTAQSDHPPPQTGSLQDDSFSRRMLGRYEMIAEIARGGMGAVYLARLEGVGGFQRLFALKLMHRHLADEAQFVHMLLDEARLAARLHHPNAVGIVDVSDSPAGYYLVMEYVDGFSLDQVLHRIEPERRIPVGIKVVLDALRGLSAAHRLSDDEGNPLGIVHRDVSPQNVLVGADGGGRITDFGIARAASRITASRPGMIKGKPCYMAPEQAQGTVELDARADIFAMGIILWEVLAGQMLFESEGGPTVTLMKVINQPIASPAMHQDGLPDALVQVCMRALERDLEKRFQSAREMGDALEEAARQSRLVARQEDVADVIKVLFADEIRIRHRAIRAHLDSLGDAGAKPMLASDIYNVPRLQARPRGSVRPGPPSPANDSGPWHETPEERDDSGIRDSIETSETMLSESGQQDLGNREPVPVPGAVPVPVDGSSPLSTASPAAMPTPEMRSKNPTNASASGGALRWAMVFGGIGAAMLIAAAFVMSGDDSEAQVVDEPALADEPAVADERAVVTTVAAQVGPSEADSPAAEVEETASTVEGAEIEEIPSGEHPPEEHRTIEVSGAETADEAEQASQASVSAEEARRRAERREARRQRREAAAMSRSDRTASPADSMSAPMATDSTTEGPMRSTPRIEGNPYL